jgi:hypothetical protein
LAQFSEGTASSRPSNAARFETLGSSSVTGCQHLAADAPSPATKSTFTRNDHPT